MTPERWLDAICKALAYVAGAILVGMVGLTVLDVALRYLLGAPLFGAHDVLQLGLLVAVFLAMPYCGRSGGHVAVDLFVEAMAPGPRRLAAIAVALMGAVMLFVLAWRSLEAGRLAAMFGAASNLLAIPFAPFYLVLAFGAALYGVVLLVDAVRAWRGPPP